MTTRSRPRASSTASCAPREDVVVGDRDRPEALRLRVVEQVGHRDGAIVRVVGVHVEVGQDQRAVRERLGGRAHQLPPAAEHGLVERLELVPRAAALSASADSRASVRTAAAPVRRPRRAGRARRRRAPAARSRREGRRAALPPRPPRRGSGADHARAGTKPAAPTRRRRPALAVEGGANGDAVAKRPGNVGPAGERARPQEDELPAWKPAQLSQGRPRRARARRLATRRGTASAGREARTRSSSIPYGSAR